MSKIPGPSIQDLLKEEEKNRTPDEPSLLGEVAKGFASGVLGLAESVGTGIEYLGGKLKDQDLVDLGDSVYNYWHDVNQRNFQADESLRGPIYDPEKGLNTELLSKGAWWAYNVANIVPSIAASYVPGAAVEKGAMALRIGERAVRWTPAVVTKLGRLGRALKSADSINRGIGAAAGGLVGGSLEGSSTYQEILQRGGTREEAASGAEQMTFASGALNMLSLNQMMKKLPKGIVGNATRRFVNGLVEGITEWLEEPSEAYIKLRLADKKGGQVKFTPEEAVQQIYQGLNVLPPSVITGMLFGGGEPASTEQVKGNEPVVDYREVPKVAGGPLTTAAQRVNVYAPLNEEGAMRRAQALSEQGVPHEAVPHPTIPNKFAVMPVEEVQDASEVRGDQGQVLREVQEERGGPGELSQAGQNASREDLQRYAQAGGETSYAGFGLKSPSKQEQEAAAQEFANMSPASRLRYISSVTFNDDLKKQSMGDVIDSEGLSEDLMQSRRRQHALRANIDEMSAEEQVAAIKVLREMATTSRLTGLKNKDAFEEMYGENFDAEDRPKFVASIDSDALKAVNDLMGHKAGDALLRATGIALGEEKGGADAFHLSGDEFALTGNDRVELEKSAKRAQERLKGMVITGTDANGRQIELHGIGFSYGIAENLQEAEHALIQDKARREQAGERAPRGELPRGIRIAGGQEQADTGASAAEEKVVGPYQEEKGPPKGGVSEPLPSSETELEGAEKPVASVELPPEKKEARQQIADNFNTRYKRVPVGEVKVGVKKVTTPEEAAHVFSSMRKRAEENFYTLVTDKNGNILDLQMHSKGTKDGASVYPEIVGPAVASVPGAANVFFAHNHPSGVPDPSRADYQITKDLTRFLDGASVNFAGHIVIGRSNNAWYFKDAFDEEPVQIRPRVRNKTVSITERMVRRIPKDEEMTDIVAGPDDTRRLLKKVSAENALLLFDNRHRFIGSLAMTPAEMKRLRVKGRVNRILTAIDTTNAAAAIVKTTDKQAGDNMSAYLGNRIRLLDVLLNEKGGDVYRSFAETGEVKESGPFASVTVKGKPRYKTKFVLDTTNMHVAKRSGRITGAPTPLLTQANVEKQAEQVLSNVETPMAMPETSPSWYERSGKFLRDMSRGNKELMERMTRIIALMSPDTGVQVNFTHAVNYAYDLALNPNVVNEWGSYPNNTQKAIELGALDLTKEFTREMWGIGPKVESFYRNLHDEVFNEDKYPGAVTIDRWMARALGYPGDRVTETQYEFAAELTRQMTEEYNHRHGTDLKPRQLQAMIWVHELNDTFTNQDPNYEPSDFSFAEAGSQSTSTIMVEAIPSDKIAPELLNLGEEESRKFTEESLALIRDKKGNDVILDALGVPLYKTRAAEGAYAGGIHPNAVIDIVPRKYRLPNGIYDRELANLYAKSLQYVFSQDSVVVERAVFNPDDISKYNRAFYIEFSEPLKPDAEQTILGALNEVVSDGVGFTRVDDNSIKVINIPDYTGLNDDVFYEKMQGIINDRHEELGIVDAHDYWSETNFDDPEAHHDWEADRQGQGLEAALQKTLTAALGESRGQSVLSRLQRIRFAHQALIEKYRGQGPGEIKNAYAEIAEQYDLFDTIEVNGVTRPTTNSKGVPISITEDGVRSFWEWFGDSKAVDDQGRPLVLYHGTESAGFKEFDTTRERSVLGQGGAFFSNNESIASTYNPGDYEEAPVYTGKQLFKNPDLLPDLEIETVYTLVDEDGEQTIEESFATKDELLEEYELGDDDQIGKLYNVYYEGDAIVEGATEQEAIDELDAFEPSKPGTYAVYIKTGDYMEVDWGGKNWNEGPEEDVWVVRGSDDYAVEYVYEEDEAKDMVNNRIGGASYYEKDTIIQYFDTNQAANDGVDLGLDTLIIRNVVDNGPHGDVWEASDDYIVYNPNNIKSVNNTGTFNPMLANILYSMSENVNLNFPEKVTDELRKFSGALNGTRITGNVSSNYMTIHTVAGSNGAEIDALLREILGTAYDAGVRETHVMTKLLQTNKDLSATMATLDSQRVLVDTRAIDNNTVSRMAVRPPSVGGVAMGSNDAIERISYGINFDAFDDYSLDDSINADPAYIDTINYLFDYGRESNMFTLPSGEPEWIDITPPSDRAVKIIASSLKSLNDVGFPTPKDIGVPTIKVGFFSSPAHNGFYDPVDRSLAMPSTLVEAIGKLGKSIHGKRGLRSLTTHLAHEMTHSIDFRRDTNGLSYTSEYMSFEASDFDLDSELMTGGGSVIRELINFYLGGESVVASAFFNYPFNKLPQYIEYSKLLELGTGLGMQGTPKYNGIKAAYEGMKRFIQSEALAQLSSLYWTRKDFVRENLPKSFKMMEGFANAIKQIKPDSGDAAVRDVLRSRSTLAGYVISEPRASSETITRSAGEEATGEGIRRTEAAEGSSRRVPGAASARSENAGEGEAGVPQWKAAGSGDLRKRWEEYADKVVAITNDADNFLSGLGDTGIKSSIEWGDSNEYKTGTEADSVTEAASDKGFVANAVRKYQQTADRALTYLGSKLTWADPLGELKDKKGYLARRRRTAGKIGKINTMTKRIFDILHQATADEAATIYKYLTTIDADMRELPDRTITTKRIRGTGMLFRQPTEVNLRKEVVAIKRLIDKVGRDLVEHGLIPPMSYEHFRYRYLPRMYLAHILDESSFRAITSGRKVSQLGYTKARDEGLPELVRIIKGEITDPAYLASKSLGTSMRDMAILDFLDDVSQETDWVLPQIMVTYNDKRVSAYWLETEGKAILGRLDYMSDQDRAIAQKEATNMISTAQKIIQEVGGIESYDGYKQVPNTPRYGHLRGVYVRQEIYDDVIGSMYTATDDSVAGRILGQGGYATKLTQLWKASKVALNPPTQVRNFVSNAILVQLSGTPMHKIPGLVFRALDEIRHNGKYWRLAQREGLTESTFAANELYRLDRSLLDLKKATGDYHALDMMKTLAGNVTDAVGDAYQFSEALFKLVKVMDAMEREGMSASDAAEAANKTLFDYSHVPASVRYLRNAPVGIPFITFYYKVLPNMVETAIRHPQRFLPYVAIPYIMAQALAQHMDVDDDDLDKLKKALPEWLQQRGHAMILPTKDEHGRWVAFDYGYMVPWGMYWDAAKDIGRGEPGELIKTMGLFGGPIPNLITAITTGKDPFTGRDIYRAEDPASKQFGDIMNYLWRMAMPTFITDIGAAGHIYRNLTGHVDPRTAQPQLTLPQAAMRTVGVNLYPIDPEYSRLRNIMFKQAEIRDIMMRGRSRAMDANLSAKEKRQVLKAYNDMAVKKIEELKRYMKESYVNPKLRVKKDESIEIPNVDFRR